MFIQKKLLKNSDAFSYNFSVKYPVKALSSRKSSDS